MTLTEQTCAQAALLAGELQPGQEKILPLLCRSAVNALTARLRLGLTPEDCKADFIAAASLFALAALGSVEDMAQVEQMRIGDVTLQSRSRDAASNCLKNQAELMILPYLKDRFSFWGV